MMTVMGYSSVVYGTLSPGLGRRCGYRIERLLWLMMMLMVIKMMLCMGSRRGSRSHDHGDNGPSGIPHDAAVVVRSGDGKGIQ